MKVLLVSPLDLAAPSGVNKQIFGLCRVLTAAGIEAHVAGSSSTQHRFGDRVHSFFATNDGTKKTAATIESQMSALIARESFDVVHSYEPLASPLTTAAMHAHAAATVATFFSRPLGADKSHAPRRWLTRLLARKSTALVDQIQGLVATSRSVQMDVREAFARDAAVIPVGIDGARFHPEARGEGDAPKTDPRTSLLKVLFVGDWQRKERGFDLLYAALERLSAMRPIELAVVGSTQKPGLAQTASLHTRFFGHVSDLRLPELYRRTDVVVAPALDKRVGGSALVEAMACGAPVIASDVGPYKELAAGSGAVLVPAANLDALVAALSVLAARPEERLLRGEANALAAESYRWEHLQGDIISLYERVSPKSRTASLAASAPTAIARAEEAALSDAPNEAAKKLRSLAL
ncbi:MAG: glycosyltransferase family 4 protein [Deltaproteobacteria bacterium]|nr:glycosyltransferase family 4 protein [Deltaproteobacteria bacterium]